MNFPYIKQKDSMDCGCAYLAMVVKYHGLHTNLVQVQEDCTLSREGVSILHDYMICNDRV